MSRIELHDSLQDALIKIVEGNPGALNACLELYTQTPAIDPDAALAGLSGIMILDTWGIYGPRIWLFYKDVCGCDCKKVLACIRAVQLGLLPETTLQHAIDNDGEGIDHDAVLKMVQERLSAFGQNKQGEKNVKT